MRSNREWLSISDMMAGLMMVFLFIAIVFLLSLIIVFSSGDKENITGNVVGVFFEGGVKICYV